MEGHHRLQGLKIGVVVAINAFMNIQVRVIAANAQKELAALRAQIAQLQGQLAAVQGSAAGAGGAAAASGSAAASGATGWAAFQARIASLPATLNTASKAMISFGSRMQWVGRQLQSNFTLPIIVAGGFAAKFAFDNEKAMTRVRKVYGDASMSIAQMTRETNALQKAFVALSNEFGVQQKDVINIAADWAAAGASGVALAKNVQQTLRVMVLGEISATEATQALIAIQSQYGANSSELIDILNALNAVENQTGVSMQGLIQAFSRTAGVARSAGIDYQHLAAMVAALVPASGSASQAGNALKTIISRLLAPTKDATAVLARMGINVADLSWKSANGSQRLETMAKKFAGLSDAQKAAVSATVASRYQINKFDILMRALEASTDGNTKSTSYYTKALDILRDKNVAARISASELNAVLNSSPQRLKQIGVIIQNVAADVIQPMIPVILGFAYAIQRVFQWFGSLNPSTQKLIMWMLLLLATVGPLVRWFSAFYVLLGVLIPPLVILGQTLLWVALGPAKLIAGAMSILFAILTALPGIIAGIPAFFVMLGAEITGAATLIGSIWTITITYISVFTSAALTALRTAWIAGWAAISAFGRLIWAAMAIAWEATLALFGAATIAWRAGLIGIWTATWAILTGITSIGGNLLLGLWTAVLALWNRLNIVFAINWSAIWSGIVAFMEGLVPIFAAVGTAIIAALTNPWTYVIAAAVAAVIAIIVAFRKQIGDIFKGIGSLILRVFNLLPSGVRNALETVVRIVQKAALAVYDLFSYMNPFAHHSPSLVDNVSQGMGAVSGTIQQVPSAIAPAMQQAHDNIHQVGQAANSVPVATQKAAKSAVTQPVNAAPAQKATLSYKQLQAAVKAARVEQANLNAAINTQQQLVDSLKDRLDNYSAAIQNAQDKMDAFVNTPIKGEKALGDQIFANEIAQKSLQLQMLKIQDVIGPVDQLQSKMSQLAGQMESLSGDKNSLVLAGAGSDITGPIDAQIAALNDQQKAINDQIAPLADLNAQLEELQRKGQELDLTKSLQFDPLHRQIEDVAKSVKELDFSTILNGVRAQKSAIDQLTAARAPIQAQYDAENAKLLAMKIRYDDITASIKQMNAQLGIQAGAKKAGALTPGEANFVAGAGGNFPDVGGSATVGREGIAGDQSAQIDAFTKQIQSQTAVAFASVDMFKPFKDAWNGFVGWIKTNIVPAFSQFGKDVATAFGSGGGLSTIGELFTKLSGPAKSFIDLIINIGKTVWQWIGNAFKLIGPVVIQIWNAIWTGLQQAWQEIQPALKNLGESLGPLFEALSSLWTVLKPALAIVLVVLLAVGRVVLSVIAGALAPAFKMIGTIIGAVINILAGAINIIAGVIKIIVGLFIGLFTGDWTTLISGFGNLFKGLIQIVQGVFQAIWGVISGAMAITWGIIKGAWEGIVGVFKWVYDLLVGHSIIPDLVNGIISFFQMMWDFFGKVWNGIVAIIQWAFNTFIKPIFDLIGMAIQGSIIAFNLLWTGVQIVWQGIGSAIQWAWNTFIKPIFDGIRIVLAVVANQFLIFQSKVQYAWALFKLGLSVIWNWIKTNVFDRIADIVTRVIPNAFDLGLKAIKKLWDTLQTIAKTPVSFVVNTVYNQGIVPFWNRIADAIGLKSSKLSPLKFAKGGEIPRVPGVTGDNVPIFATAGERMLSLDQVRTLGGQQGIDKIIENAKQKRSYATTNQPASSGNGYIRHYSPQGKNNKTKSGGFLDPIIKGFGEIFAGALEVVATPAVNAIRNVISSMPYGQTPYGQMIVKTPNVMLDKILNFLRQKDSATQAAGGGENFGPFAGGVGVPSYNNIIAFARKSGIPFNVSSTFRPGSVSNSGHHDYHSTGNAVDMASGTGNMVRLAQYWYKYFPYLLEEIHSGGGGYFVKNGRKVSSSYYASEVAGHYDHVHIAATNAGIGGAVRAAGLIVGSGGGAIPTGSSPKSYAYGLLKNYGWNADSQWPSLNTLWDHESGWNYRSRNPSSGAYGIPQALPASKMATVGADYLTNPATQIRWGLGYIRSRYGSPSSAWSFWQGHRWYDDGGWLPPGRTLAYNGTGHNEAILTAEQWRVLARISGRMMTTRTPGLGAGAAVMGSDAVTGGMTVVINGDLSFPNIKNGEDAETFLANLEAIARQ